MISVTKTNGQIEDEKLFFSHTGSCIFCMGNGAANK
jgi:hypothetical protein